MCFKPLLGRFGSSLSMRRVPPDSYGSVSTPGGLLETVVLVFDSGNELVIHAMKARPQMFDLLP